MTFLFQYIKEVDYRSLKIEEVRQCLLYLDYMEIFDPEMEVKSRLIRQKLQKRLSDLEGDEKEENISFL